MAKQSSSSCVPDGEMMKSIASSTTTACIEDQATSSCYGTMPPSLNVSMTASNRVCGELSDPIFEFDSDFEGPRFQYDFDFDLRALRDALRRSEKLEESGYQSVIARSQHSPYGTGWLMADTVSIASNNSCDDWDGYMVVGKEKVKIKEMADLLATRYAFLSGSRTGDGFPLLTFPDSRVHIPFPDYKRLVTYLLHVPLMEDAQYGYVVVVDRRLDKWSSVKTFLIHLSVVVCQNVQELQMYVERGCLTVDLNGSLRYNHLEWVQHRMDIERMTSCASMIANSLDDFTRCLKDTELPNDAETTEHILRTQISEREAIEEDFRIAVRRGQSLLKNVRQADVKPRPEQLSPTRLHNVTTIQRMLIQLDETERSFNKFWTLHEQRLRQCLQLRRFEEDFRKLQSNFAGHMLYLEEHKEVGENVQRADEFIMLHKEYMDDAKKDMAEGVDLARRGEELMALEETALAGSLQPKVQELSRMTDALHSALSRRLHLLQLSKHMHQQITMANEWCSEGVELLSSLPYDVHSREDALASVDDLGGFLYSDVGEKLQSFCMQFRTGEEPELSNLMLMTTTETSTLLQQVAARIEDVRRMCESRHENLQKQVEKEKKQHKPVQVVTPEKVNNNKKQRMSPSPKKEIHVLHPPDRRTSLPVTSSPNSSSSSQMEMMSDSEQRGSSSPPNTVLLDVCSSSPSTPCHSTPSTSRSAYVINELLSTEEAYVEELGEMVEFYMKEMENPHSLPLIPMTLRGRQREIFGNIPELLHFHQNVFLKDLRRSSKESRGVAASVGRCFRERISEFYLYNVYCQNKPRSESIRQSVGENCVFFQECQKRAGHRLPLGAYLLKPVQRITKYQLLLKELAKEVRRGSEEATDVDVALEDMLNLLQTLNASMHQAHISGYPGDLSSLGQLLLESKFNVWTYRKAGERGSSLKLRKTSKTQQRHVFLFSKALVFCKRRVQPPPYSKEYYEFKHEVPIATMCVTEQVKGHGNRFEISSDSKAEVYILQPDEHRIKSEWIKRIKQLEEGPAVVRVDRPQSWGSSSPSSEPGSNRSSRDLSSLAEFPERGCGGVGDRNNNPSPEEIMEGTTITTSLPADDQNNPLGFKNTDSSNYQVMYGYTARTEDEISVNVGDSVTVLGKSDTKEWTLVQKETSTTTATPGLIPENKGWIPSNYLGMANTTTC